VSQYIMNNLWIEFKNRIKEDWETKYAEFGELENIEGQTNFCRALENDMYLTLDIPRKKTGVVPSWNTLNTYFNQDSLGKKPKQKTIDIIVRYLGYDSIESFKKIANTTTISNVATQAVEVEKTSGELRVLEKEVNNSIQISEAKSKPIHKAKRSKFIYLFGLIPILIASIFGYNYYTENLLKEEIKQLIINANKLEFDLSRIPVNIEDQKKLDWYFSNNSVAKKKIEATVKNLNTRPRRFSEEESSYYSTVKMNTYEREGDKITINTIESWRQVWYNTETEERYAYATDGKQTYLIIKEEGKWKINAIIHVKNKLN